MPRPVCASVDLATPARRRRRDAALAPSADRIRRARAATPRATRRDGRVPRRRRTVGSRRGRSPSRSPGGRTLRTGRRSLGARARPHLPAGHLRGAVPARVDQGRPARALRRGDRGTGRRPPDPRLPTRAIAHRPADEARVEPDDAVRPDLAEAGERAPADEEAAVGDLLGVSHRPRGTWVGRRIVADQRGRLRGRVEPDAQRPRRDARAAYGREAALSKIVSVPSE